MLITEIMQYLDSELASITYDATGSTGNIYMGDLPKTPDTAVAVISVGGPVASIKHDYDNPSIQIFVRGTRDPRVGYNLALEIYNKLHGFGSAVLFAGGLWIVSCEGMQSEPVYIGRDDNFRHRYSINFQFMIKRDSDFRS